MQYVVVNVGCLECREESSILGIYDTLEQAGANHPDAKYIVNENSVEYGITQEQILRFDPDIPKKDLALF